MLAIRTTYFLLSLVLTCALAAGAHGEELAIPGSGNPEYLLRQLADSFNAEQSRHRITVPTSTGTAGALRDVAAGTATLGRVGRRLKGEELNLGLVFIPIGRDPVVFVAGAGVTVRGISSDEAVAVFRGDILDWSELGGAPGPIRAIGREPSDASRQAIMAHITGFRDLAYGPHVKVVHLDPEMVALLDRFPTSLGTLNRSALHACKTSIVVLALDGVEPTADTVATGRYPLSLEFGLIYKPGQLTAAGEAFIEFIRSPQGTRIIEGLGVIPAAGGP